ncbi:MAG: hypothetical protein A2144_12425 [Chloroflexi bacterium RBG_16_50_9]|nr:MAG: hypothetical protein A2144_12425 [Chloroflexi bacterium RBG_16_50_9]
MIRFPVPDTLKVSDAKLCYQGEEPYSYGKLTGGDMVAVYDWDLKKAVPEELAKTTMTLQGWEFVLNKVTWDKSTLKINLTITNTMYRRQFGHPSDTAELAAIDSTGKMIKPWHPEPKTREEFLSAVFAGEPYQGEYYPNESKTVELKFEMHPLSGQTSLYYGQYYWTKSFKLFDVGAPE